MFGWCVAISLLLLTAAPTVGAAQATGTASAGAEHHRIRFFAGDWVFTGKMDGTVFGPGQPNSIGESCQMIGDFFVTCRYEVKRVNSLLRGLDVLGYDAAERLYTFTSCDSQGVVGHGKGTAQGDTWSLAFGATSRVTWKELSATSYAITIEGLQADGRWVATMDGTYQRRK